MRVTSAAGAGHVHTFHNEGTANGGVVLSPGDIVILPYCRYVVDAVELTITNGFITRISGGLGAKPMRDCTVALDGETIIERGKFVDSKMVVAREAR